MLPRTYLQREIEKAKGLILNLYLFIHLVCIYLFKNYDDISLKLTLLEGQNKHHGEKQAAFNVNHFTTVKHLCTQQRNSRTASSKFEVRIKFYESDTHI